MARPAVSPPPAAVRVASRRAALAAWPQLAGCLWGAGAAAWFGMAGVGWYRLARRLRACPQDEGEAQALVSRIGATLDLRSVPAVHLIDGVLSPALVALDRRPRLLIPMALWAHLDGPRRSGLIAHELAHYRRRDHWLRPLELIVLGLYWWFPVAWWVRRSLRHSEELCCDAWVVWAFPQQRRAYASALLDTLDFLADGPARVPVLASGMGGATAIRQRLAFIARGRAVRRLSWIAAAGVAGVAGAVLPLGPPVRADRRAWMVESLGVGGEATAHGLASEAARGTMTSQGRTIPMSLPMANYDFDLAPDGSWVVAGVLWRERWAPQRPSFHGTPPRRVAVLKFRRDGTPDPDFGDAGILVTDISPASSVALLRDAHVAVQADGKIVVATSVEGHLEGRFADVHLARFLADGTADSGFGEGGSVTLNVGRVLGQPEAGSIDAVAGLAIQSDGRFVVAASSSADLPADRFAVVRLLPDGTPDPGFGVAGRMRLDDPEPAFTPALGLPYRASDQVRALAIGPGGRILLAGMAGPPGLVDSFRGPWKVVALDARGWPDPSFGRGGTVLLDPFALLGVRASAGFVEGLAALPDGRIAVAGGVAGPWRLAPLVFALDARGALDPGFGIGGAARPVPPDHLWPRDLAAAPDGRLFLAGSLGYRADSREGDLAIAALTARGRPDERFGGGGWLRLDATGWPEHATRIRVGPDGRPAVAGFAAVGGVGTVPVVARFRDHARPARLVAAVGAGTFVMAAGLVLAAVRDGGRPQRRKEVTA
jgi:uncharacterized delta-60 repeat protein